MAKIEKKFRNRTQIIFQFYMKKCPPTFSGGPQGWENDVISGFSQQKELWHISKFSEYSGQLKNPTCASGTVWGGGPLAVGRNVAICCHWVAMRDQGWNTEKPQKITKMAHNCNDKSLIVISILYLPPAWPAPLNKSILPKFTFISGLLISNIKWIVYCIITITVFGLFGRCLFDNNRRF